MADTQYDVSPEMRELFERKQKQRAATKAYYRKQIYNPYMQREPVGIKLIKLFDPVHFRYGAFSAYADDVIQPSAKRRTITTVLLLPFFIIGGLMYWRRMAAEEKYSAGLVSYAERRNERNI